MYINTPNSSSPIMFQVQLVFDIKKNGLKLFRSRNRTQEVTRDTKDFLSLHSTWLHVDV